MQCVEVVTLWLEKTNVFLFVAGWFVGSYLDKLFVEQIDLEINDWFSFNFLSSFLVVPAVLLILTPNWKQYDLLLG